MSYYYQSHYSLLSSAFGLSEQEANATADQSQLQHVHQLLQHRGSIHRPFQSTWLRQSVQIKSSFL